MDIDLTISVWEEGGQFVAQAMPLDVLSSGATPEAAREAVSKAVRCFLMTARDTGTLNEVLTDCGYHKLDGSWRSPAWVGIERRALKIPA
jgi:predicted RNase H-like HicB family nuclease